jgi:hypothetical protein
MPNEDSKPTESASDQIFRHIEQNLEPGGVRDLWLSLRKELTEGGPEAVRTYLASEYQRRKAIVQIALDELTNQLEETV